MIAHEPPASSLLRVPGPGAVGAPPSTRLAGRLAAPEVLPLAVAALTAAVHAPALWNGFLDWDDHVNFVKNENYRGLGWTQLRWMAGAVLMGQWVPLTWLTLGLDYVVWGMEPFGYHLTNVVLHAANAAVFFLVARRLLARAAGGEDGRLLPWGALAAALFFAIHPLRAESVAWVTERRDVLSGLFFLLTVLGYLHAQEAPAGRRRRWLVGSIAAYALACLSKSMVVTLPVLLLVLDVHPLGRLAGHSWRSRHALGLVTEKLPYFGLALLTGGMAVYAQASNRFLTSLDTLPLLDRLPVAAYGVWFYVSRTVLPVDLSPLHELPARIDPLEPRFVASAIGVLALTAAFILLRRAWPAGLAAWAAYLIALAPVSGLVHNGHQLAHDRYSYLPGLAWALLLGGAVCALGRAARGDVLRPALARLAAGALALWIAALGTMTWHQVQVWRDNDSLWRFALEADPRCAICHGNLGVSLMSQHLVGPAIERFERALELRPDRKRTHGNLGLALLNAGRPGQAVPHFEQALAAHPADADTRINLAVALLHLGRPQEAVPHLEAVLARDPRHPLALTNLAAARLDAGDAGQAVALLETAVDARPKLAQPRAGLVRAHLVLGDVDRALAQLAVLRTLDPALAGSLDRTLFAVW